MPSGFRSRKSAAAPDSASPHSYVRSAVKRGYLENIRISEAKKLLGQGVPPLETALRTGFSDQSHFTNYFRRFIGLAPGVYREIFLDKA